MHSPTILYQEIFCFSDCPIAYQLKYEGLTLDLFSWHGKSLTVFQQEINNLIFEMWPLRFLLKRIWENLVGLVGLRHETQRIIECHERLMLGFTYVLPNLLDWTCLNSPIPHISFRILNRNVITFQWGGSQWSHLKK